MPERKIRILVVDDSVVIRRIVTDALAADPGLEVVGVAANGRIALAKLSQLNPDLITLDLEMPEMDGLQTLSALRKSHKQLPVIMFSTVTERGATATLEALARGANDYVTKPSNVDGAAAAVERVRAQLIPAIKAHCRALAAPWSQPGTRLISKSGAGAPRELKPPDLYAPVEVVAIGVSTGGPNALAEVLPRLPAGLPVPLVIVQHMPPIFTRLLAERLASKSQIRVIEARGGEAVEAGGAWIAPGDYHMALQRNGTSVRISTHKGSYENSCRPSVDVLFRSVAEIYGPNALGVILTGMGQDGLQGCERIRGAGGRILAQDEATSVVWGMPGLVAQAGLAEGVFPIGDLAGEIVRRVSKYRTLVAQSPAGIEPRGEVSSDYAAQRRRI